MSEKDEPTMSLKLLIDTRAKRVLFAEAGKDFVDFLFSLMSLPVGTVIRLLSDGDMMGSLGKVYQSIQTLNDAYVKPEATKDALLIPNNDVVYDGAAKLLSLSNVARPVYICANCHNNASQVDTDTCPGCSRVMSQQVEVVSSKASSLRGGIGYVKECVTFMVMDDLEVKPISTISTLALINTYGIREMGDLQEKLVSLGMKEGLKLLKLSLESKTVLTDVFLGPRSCVVGDIPV